MTGAAPHAKRRVLLVSPQPLFDDRGTPIAVRQVLEALTELGYRVDVVTYPIGQTLEIPGVTLVRARNPFRIRRVPIGFSLRKVLLDASLTITLARCLRGGKYVCVHAVEEAAFPAVVLAGRAGVPVIYDMQSSLPEQMVSRVFRTPIMQALLKRSEGWLLSRAGIVASSTGLSDHVRRIAPGTRVREWQYPGLPLQPATDEVADLRRSLQLPQGARVVFYCGTFEHYQGLQTLLQAVPLVRQSVPEAVFVLVGADQRGMAALAEPLKGIERAAVRIVARQPKERIPAYALLADVLVSPRLHGGNLPLKIFDYLAAGRPIVATDIPAHRSVLNEERALLVQPTARGIGGGISQLLRDPELAARIASGAARFAQETLGWMTFVKWVGELYADIQLPAPAPQREV